MPDFGQPARFNLLIQPEKCSSLALSGCLHHFFVRSLGLCQFLAGHGIARQLFRQDFKNFDHLKHMIIIFWPEEKFLSRECETHPTVHITAVPACDFPEWGFRHRSSALPSLRLRPEEQTGANQLTAARSGPPVSALSVIFRWPWHTAVALGAEVNYPPQYERSSHKIWPGANAFR